MKTLFKAVVAGLMSWAAMSAQAHKPSDSYLVIDVDGSHVRGQWDIALRDVDIAIGLDTDGDGAITWREVRGHHAEIAAYALSRLSLSRGSNACALVTGEQLIDEHTDGMYSVLRFSATCAVAGDLTVDYSLLFDQDPQHRGLLRIVQAGLSQESAVFSAASHQRTFGHVSSGLESFKSFVVDGVKHIAIGADHILFLIALLLPAVMVREGARWRPAAGFPETLRQVVGIVTAFTIAHSITLSLAALGFLHVPSRIVESLIALSVVLTAADNVFPFLPRKRWRIAFAFGLLHGLGFASVLLDLGLPRDALAISLFGFNLGVEIGQLALVALLLPAAFMIRHRPAYPRFALGAGSLVIALVALGWLLERSLSMPFMPF